MKSTRLKTFTMLSSAILLTVGLAIPSVASATVPDVNELVSISSGSTQGNNTSTSSANSVSGDGRYVVFYSQATNLVSAGTNGHNQVFVRDRTNGTTTLVSVSSSGTEANASSIDPAISYDGQYVVFTSVATNLVSGVTDGSLHIYLHDMNTGTTSIVDTSASSTVSNGESDNADISADGRYVVFDSSATNLTSSGTNGDSQIYIKDIQTGAIQELSVNSSGTEGNHGSGQPVISCDGGVVAFESGASNLVSGDTNGYGDVFVDSLGWDSNQLTDISLGGNETSQDPTVSCNGNDVAYDTYATNLASSLPSSSESVLEYSRLSTDTSVVSSNSSGTPASGYSQFPAISDDGRYISFLSTATSNLDSSKSYDQFGAKIQIFVKDMQQGTTQVLSIDGAGDGVSGNTDWPSISADGSIVAYDSLAEDNVGGYSQGGLVSSDSNGYQDVFDSETGF